MVKETILSDEDVNLIGTFCIVNYKSKKFNVSISVYLIGTFCIVNVT